MIYEIRNTDKGKLAVINVTVWLQNYEILYHSDGAWLYPGAGFK
jgi:hypothetical protein